MHYLYKITNIVNQKTYIGQTISPTQRWYAHQSASANPKVPLQFAIKKYGNHNFDFQIIAQCVSQDDANYLETELVKQYNSYIANGKGYNATFGGMNAPKTEEWKQIMSDKMKNIWQNNPDTWKSLIGNRWNEGKKQSKETIKKRVDKYKQYYKDKPGPTVGRSIHSEEHKTKLSKAWKGIKNPNYGKPLPEKTKEKLRRFDIDTRNSIIKEYQSEGVSLRQLARKYDTSPGTIRKIVIGVP